MSKHRTVLTGIQTDEHGIFVVISVSNEHGEDSIVISGSEACELIPKIRIHIEEIMTKSRGWAAEDWK